MGSELKPCPFCGGDHIGSREVDHTWQVECASCWVVMPHPAGRTRAEADWNRRPIEDALRARAEAAEQRAKALWREVTRLRAVIAETADHLPTHPPTALLTHDEQDAEDVRICLLAALGGGQ